MKLVSSLNREKNTTKDSENLRKYYLLCIHHEPQKLANIFLSATSSKLTDYNAVCNSENKTACVML